MTTPLPLTQMVHHAENNKLADENQIKTRIIQLDRSNWVQWSCEMKNYLKGCGYQELLHAPSDTVKITLKYECKNSAALAMLWTSVCDYLQGVLLEHKYLFFDAWEALGDACGRNSIITKFEALFGLISLQYGPGHNSIVAKFQQDGNLYSTRSPTNIAWYSSPRVTKDWPSLCGHPSDKYLRHILKKNNINQSFISRKNCEGCRYVLALLDDSNRFNRIIFLKSKDQASREILTFINKIKNKFNKVPSYLHSDQGGEFMSNSFLSTLKQEGVSMEQGAPYSPQTNRVAEQFNRSLLSKRRCLLNQSNIPVSYWDQAATHASLLLNNTPHCFLNMMTLAKFLENNDAAIEPCLNFS
ncbi:hypothetical protein O181_059420 [Austropuccinia psidii MF-1]|uniref:Integrase catalytic domain-containing protein n=1 Tax=Austropuccinia psidii MF-1 TaxID=1389203 RepID=A0A9Q3EBE6_9BASI|nr:hypothetical protein [Austropuccinia psidii MF-1]